MKRSPRRHRGRGRARELRAATDEVRTATEGLFYTSSAHIGIGLSLLLIGRFGYRLIHSYFSTAGFFTQPPADFVKSPLTLMIIGTLAGDYATYAFGLLRGQRGVHAAP